MADVFVSYKKSDKDRVRPLVENLRAAGLEVWWDEGIQPSMSWRGEIAKQLDGARCVVAVWTHDSVDHDGGQWVMEEAGRGLARRVLAPVRLDLVSPPLGFGEVQYADLAAWSGKSDDPRFQHFLGVVQAIVRAEPMPMTPTPTQFEAPGVKMQNVRMENVRIQVGERGGGSIQVGESADGETDSDPPPPSREVPARASVSPSMVLTKAIGVIFPLVALIVFVVSMGHLACGQGHAPALLCRALNSVAAP